MPDVVDARGYILTGADSSAAARFDAVIDDIYYSRLGVGDRLDTLLARYPTFMLAHVQKGYSLPFGRYCDGRRPASGSGLKSISESALND